MNFELITVSSREMTRAQASEVIALCSDVFRLDYAYYMNLCPDRVHVLGYADQRLVSHALWLSRRLRAGTGPWLDAAYVEGVATHPDYRACGYGSALMQHLQQEISRFDLGALSPATARVEWYERLGWLRWQGPLFILKNGETLATPDDAVMMYRTPQSGAVDVSTALTGEWRPFELW